jgi:hypothetical protein
MILSCEHMGYLDQLGIGPTSILAPMPRPRF